MLLVMFGLSARTQAFVEYWQGADTNWGTIGNWWTAGPGGPNGSLPATTDNTWVRSGTATVNAGDSFTVNSLWAQGAITLKDGGYLEITGATDSGNPGYAATYLNGSTFTQDGGTFITSSLANGNGTYRVTGGTATLGGIWIYWGFGTMDVGGTANITITGVLSCEAGFITLRGHQASVSASNLPNFGSNNGAGSVFKAVLDSDSGFSTLNLTNNMIIDPRATFALELASGFTPSAGMSWTIIRTGMGITHTFSNLPEGGVITAGGVAFTASYAGGNLVLTNTAAADYTAWANQNNVAGTIDEDSDNDGVPNGIEYFMGQPGTGFTANPGLDGGHKISWAKGTGYTGVYGINYFVQTSSNLKDWADVPEADVTIGSTLQYTLTGAGPRFVRLKVTGP